MSKVKLNRINECFPGSSYILMLGLGFDGRCLETVKNFSTDKLSHVIGVSNAGWSDSNNKNISEFREITQGLGIILGENAVNVIEVADAVSEHIRPLLMSSADSFIIDVTSFSHELLSVLLGVMDNLKVLDKVTLLYVGATQYSFNTSSDNMWLSRGVKTIRSVLGFPGTMLPSQKLHLIMLSGFEVERAYEIIVRYEPTYLSLGIGKRNESISSSHYERNRIFSDKLNTLIKEHEVYREKVYHFEFSCIDPCQTKNDLIAHMESLPEGKERNFVVCPLNTKLSTVGATLAALAHPHIQLCYAEPIEYNTEGYASPGDEVTIVDLKSCTIY